MNARVELPNLTVSFGRSHEGRYLECDRHKTWRLYDADGSLVRTMNRFENRLIQAAYRPMSGPAEGYAEFQAGRTAKIIELRDQLTVTEGERDMWKAQADALRAERDNWEREATLCRQAVTSLERVLIDRGAALAQAGVAVAVRTQERDEAREMYRQHTQLLGPLLRFAWRLVRQRYLRMP